LLGQEEILYGHLYFLVYKYAGGRVGDRPRSTEEGIVRAGILNAPNDIGLREVPDPVAERGDLILRVKAATVCGTDIRILRGKKTAGIRYPAIIGHEFAGEVVEAAGGKDFRIGQRVSVDPAIPCGRCHYCKTGLENICANLVAIGYDLDGAFAEYIRIPARALACGNVREIPDELSYEEASLTEPLACVVNGQQKVMVKAGDGVVVLGAGPIGLLHIKLARFSGARRVIVSEPNALRREAALAAGADVVIDPTAEDPVAVVRAETGGLGADVAIVAIGVPALANLALSVVKQRGRVSLFAGFSMGETAPLDVNLIHYGELVVTGAFGLSRATFDSAFDLLARKRIDVKPFITQRYGLSDLGQALECAAGGTAVKVAIMEDSHVRATDVQPA
jgi:L-iditol 2-dehydrogenase